MILAHTEVEVRNQQYLQQLLKHHFRLRTRSQCSFCDEPRVDHAKDPLFHHLNAMYGILLSSLSVTLLQLKHCLVVVADSQVDLALLLVYLLSLASSSVLLHDFLLLASSDGTIQILARLVLAQFSLSFDVVHA